MRSSTLPGRVRTWANAGTALGTIVGGIVLLAVFYLWISPWLRDNMGGANLLDEMRWNSPADLTATITTYGEEGRDFYRNFLLVDLGFPIVYSIPLALSVAFAAPELHRLRRFAHIAPLLPIAGGIFDWGENILFLIQMSQFPDHSGSLSWLALVMTFLKFTALILSVFIILCGLWAYRQESKKPS